MYSCSKDPRYIDENQQRRGRSAGQTKLKITFPFTSKYQQSIFYQGPRLWDSLPTRLKEADTINSFKTQLHKMYKDAFLKERKV